MDISLNELVSINLQYDAGVAALGKRATAQLIAKVLYASGRLVSQDFGTIAAEVSRILGIRKISREQLEMGLGFLEELRFARKSGQRWMLTDTGFETIDADVSRASARLDGVLARHFPGRVERAKLRAWFTDACVRFYELYGSQWAATVARKKPTVSFSRGTIAGMLSATISAHGLKAEEPDLVTGFYSFVTSTDREDEDHNWSLSQSMLAARLVALNVGPDPVTSREFLGALLLLDTNALLVTALEGHRLSRSFEELGRVLSHIGVSVSYIEETRDEYRRVVAAKKAAIGATFERLPRSVLRDSPDAFISTALDRQCNVQDDLNTFFDELLDPPTTIGDHAELTLLDVPEAIALGARGSTDEHLIGEISAASARRGKQKRHRAAEHDAALTTVAEGMTSEGRKCVVLTLDKGMHEHALARAGGNGLPQWISLDALIQILAVDNAGPALESANFGPLMASIIRHQCEPIMETYVAEDLAMILDVEERCAQLDPDQIKKIATVAARERLKGRRRDDPEAILNVQRAFQGGKFALADQVVADRATMRKQGDRLTEVSRDREIAIESFVESHTVEIRRHAGRRLAIEVGGVVIVAALMELGILKVMAWATDKATLSYVADLLAAATPLVACNS